MINFIQETLNIMELNGKQKDDIKHIGSKDCYIEIDDFFRVFDVDYDNSFGSPHMPTDMVIIFNDGSWLERHEYDGSEWWEFKQTPKICTERKFTRKDKVFEYHMWSKLVEFENGQKYKSEFKYFKAI